MAVYNIKILGSDGTSSSQPIGSSSEFVLIQNEGSTTLTTKLQSITTSISNINTSLNGKASTAVATTDSNGLMSSTDKTKLNGLQNYTLPVAGTSLGGVKTTSSVSSTSGLIACPIIGGIVYYKDTLPTTYTLNSFGVTASATELNYTKGVTSGIQSQLDGKAPSVHSHSASNIGEGTFSSTKVYAATGTDYDISRVRNIVFTNSDPGAEQSTSQVNGSLICVYE